MPWNNANYSSWRVRSCKTRSTQSSCLMPVAASPACCLLPCLGWPTSTRMIQKDVQNFPAIPTLRRIIYLCCNWQYLWAFVLPLLKNNKVSPKLNMSIHFVASFFRIITFILFFINRQQVFKGFCGIIINHITLHRWPIIRDIQYFICCDKTKLLFILMLLLFLTFPPWCSRNIN